MKRFFVKNIISNSIIGLVCVAILISPLIVDYSNLPRGFEINKVFFINTISGIILTLYILSKFVQTVRRKQFPTVGKIDVIFFFGLLLSLSLSSLFSPYQETTYFGNSFRFQGFYTHLFLLTTAYIVYKVLREKHLKIILLVFTISGLIQALIGLNQFFYLGQNDPAALQDGFWVNGTFGQTNWFAGRLLITIFICCFLFLRTRFANKKIDFIFRTVTLTTLVLSIATIIFSFSVWATITFLIFIVLFFLIQFPRQRIKNFIYYFIALCILILNFYIVFLYPSFDLHAQIPREIINVIKSDNYEPGRIVFGYGFDTLGEVFRDRNIFAGSLVDRAHNVFFDIFVQGGLFLLGLTLSIFIYIFRNLKNNENRYFHLFLFLSLLWLFRSTIHESGIVNLLDFAILIGITLNLRNNTSS